MVEDPLMVQWYVGYLHGRASSHGAMVAIFVVEQPLMV